MIHTLFFSRFRSDMSPELLEEYNAQSADLVKRVREHFPGFVDAKKFLSEDGERLTVVRFEDDEALKAWSRDPEHMDGKRRGRKDYFGEYRIVVCEEVREMKWERED